MCIRDRCKVLLHHGWVKNILFLADRNSLVTQAKRSFVNLLPDLSVTNLCEEKENVAAHCVFSTYQTMMNCIDTVSDEEGKLFTAGHFEDVYKRQITDLAVQESEIKKIPANTVIMSFKLSLGKTAITKTPVYTNEAIMALSLIHI